MSQQSYVPAFLSQFLTRTFLAAIPQAEKEMCDYFASFTEKLISAADEGKLVPKSKLSAKETIMEIWKSVSASLAENIQSGIDKALVKKMNEESKTKQKLETLKLPTCGRRSGPNTKYPNKECGKPCVDKTVYKDKDGREFCLCKKHTKNAGSKNSCEWEYGDEAPKKNGAKCGCRVKSPNAYNTPGSWKGVTYLGLKLCDKHVRKANENLEKNGHKCKYSGNKGDRECDKLQKHMRDDKTGVFTWLSDMCSKHSKKDKKKNSKQDMDQRKNLKQGKNTGEKNDKSEQKSDKEKTAEKSKNNEASKKAEKSKKNEKVKKNEKSDEGSDVESEYDESENESDDDQKDQENQENENNKKNDKEEKKEEKKEKEKEKSEILVSTQKDRRPTVPLEAEEKNLQVEKSNIEKLITKENFSLKGERTPIWKVHTIKDGDGEDLNIFIDVTSGLVVYNEEFLDAKELEEDQMEGLKVYGIWDNDGQEVVELTSAAKKYANKLGLEVDE